MSGPREGGGDLLVILEGRGGLMSGPRGVQGVL